MNAKLMELLISLIPYGIILLIGATVSWIFFFLRRRDLFGGFVGGLVIAILGAVIGIFLDRLIIDYVRKALEFLIDAGGVNIIMGFLGAYLAVWVMNKLNHDKKRDRY